MLVKTSIFVGQYFTDDNNESKGRLKAIFEMEDHLGNVDVKYRLNYIPGVDIIVSENKFLSTYKRAKNYLAKGSICEVYFPNKAKYLVYADGKGSFTSDSKGYNTLSNAGVTYLRTVEKPKT